MKKSLLFCLALAATASTAMADVKTPTVYPGITFKCISADGSIAAGDDQMGSVVVYNLTDGTQKVFEAVEDWENPENNASYSIGYGNCITADGKTIVGSTIENGTAAYIYNGEWHLLDVSDKENSNLAHGITPDGSRICGNLGIAPITLDDGAIMCTPAYWDRNADGKGYGKYNQLPYPTKDFFGMTPQYITAVSISADGKTIVGQMVFGSGMMAVPVVYTQDDKGEWSYSLPTKDLFNPDKIEAVEDPGEGPAMPSCEEYMTEEEKAAYADAIQDYYDSGYTIPYPAEKDYMTAEEIAQYDAAMDKYDEENDVWSEKWDAYSEYREKVMAASPNFVFNSCYLSTDGKQIVSTLESEVPDDDPMAWFPFKNVYNPCTVDIATGELKTFEVEALPSGVADNGVILAASNVQDAGDGYPIVGYIIKGDKVQTVAEYIAEQSSELGEWIDKNMKHEVMLYVYDEDLEVYVEEIEEMLFVGVPVSTPDLSKIAVWTPSEWGDEWFETTLFDFTPSAGIASIIAGNKALKLVDGSIVVPEGFASLEIYNVGGSCVKAVAQPAGSVKLNLNNGVYIAKGVRNDGSVSILKVTK